MIFGSEKGGQSAGLSTVLLRPGTLMSLTYPKHLRCGCPVSDMDVLEMNLQNLHREEFVEILVVFIRHKKS